MHTAYAQMQRSNCMYKCMPAIYSPCTFRLSHARVFPVDGLAFPVMPGPV